MPHFTQLFATARTVVVVAVVAAGCGNGGRSSPTSAAPAPAAPRYRNVPPASFLAQKLTGERPPLPDDLDIAVAKAGGGQVTAIYKMCASPAGAVVQLATIQSSGTKAADDAIGTVLRNWT